MSKFKVGDKVKLVSMKNEGSFYKKYLGKIFTIKQVGCVAVTFKEATEENISPYLYNLQKVEEKYTYEDLKKSPVGTKITFEDGNVFFKDNEYRYINIGGIRINEWLSNLRDDMGQLGKIIKIEEPTYTTVYESKAEILDEAEKRYLSSVIRPFRDKIKYIAKYHSTTIYEECILIHISNNPNIMLPYFKEDSMYKGMKIDKEYTLEELGL